MTDDERITAGAQAVIEHSGLSWEALNPAWRDIYRERVKQVLHAVGATDFGEPRQNRHKINRYRMQGYQKKRLRRFGLTKEEVELRIKLDWMSAVAYHMPETFPDEKTELVSFRDRNSIRSWERLNFNRSRRDLRGRPSDDQLRWFMPLYERMQRWDRMRREVVDADDSDETKHARPSTNFVWQDPKKHLPYSWIQMFMQYMWGVEELRDPPSTGWSEDQE